MHRAAVDLDAVLLDERRLGLDAGFESSPSRGLKVLLWLSAALENAPLFVTRDHPVVQTGRLPTGAPRVGTASATAERPVD